MNIERGAALARCAAVACVLSVSLLGGCAESLIETPYVMYGDAGRNVYGTTPAHLRTPELPVVYVTDRQAMEPGDKGVRYGYGRSPSMEYGIATVSLGADVTWDELVADSVGAERKHSYTPRVVKVEKTGCFLPMVTHVEVLNGRLVARQGGVEALYAEQDEFAKTLDRYLDQTERKEAVVFVHGFNNTFDDAVLRLAQAWHFTGRQGVPIVFTWPAGSGGLRGYTQDRESGEYANLHLKILLVSLARNPKIERVHIVSHSRGTDVASTALRELNAELRAGLGRSIVCRMLGVAKTDGTVSAASADARLPYAPLKLETLVLAAPDLDLDVFSQRFVGDNVLNAANRTVIYFSEGDSALGWANWLFGSRNRVGNFTAADLKPEARALIGELSGLQLINCNVRGGSSHSYVMQHPAALSDLILLIRDRKPPGAENGRPLKVPFKGFWNLENDYLKPGQSS